MAPAVVVAASQSPIVVDGEPAGRPGLDVQDAPWRQVEGAFQVTESLVVELVSTPSPSKIAASGHISRPLLHRRGVTTPLGGRPSGDTADLDPDWRIRSIVTSVPISTGSIVTW
jgi:hypothetical protein